MVEQLRQNAVALEGELLWLSQLIDARLALHFNQDSEVGHLSAIEPPPVNSQSSYGAFLLKYHLLDWRERAAIALALAPHLRPRLLDVFFTKNQRFDREFSEFGGLQNSSHSGFLPTGETLLFLLAGMDLTERLIAGVLFHEDHPFRKFSLLYMAPPKSNEPPYSGALQISEASRSFISMSKEYEPTYSYSFPAEKLTTERQWEALILPPANKERLEEIVLWETHHKTMMEELELKNKLRPGYRVLFYGPPGTGKTFAASLIGRRVGRPVYRIDLSMVVSKYIGETEKNLSRVFNEAQHRHWILFFDEADALFGKRTEVRDAHDRYANQEVAYLLQRIEHFDGIVILATNKKDHIDPAFARRFENAVYFPQPGPKERLKIWQAALPAKILPDSQAEKAWEKLSLPEIAAKYDIPGGKIMNVVQHVSLHSLAREEVLQKEMLELSIQRELNKM